MVGTLKLMDEITDHYDVVMYDVDIYIYLTPIVKDESQEILCRYVG